MQKIAIIGNAGGGKTRLSRALGRTLEIPIYHVDSIQLKPGWQLTPLKECNRCLAEILDENSWLIDGGGGRDAIELRLHAADTVVFVDLPIWLHYWWVIKRQMMSDIHPREELPERCPEFSLSHTRKLFSILWYLHKEYTPWMRDKVARLPSEIQVFHIRSKKDWRAFFDCYCRN